MNHTCARLCICFLLFAFPLWGQRGDRSEIDRSTVPEEWDIPPAPVLTPEEALETFVLQPGFRIELVASEPLVHDPVAMDFDEDGRMWVVEMRSYMPNVDGEGEVEPVSRVVVLEDTDDDGVMDTSTVYMEDLVLPRAIQVVEGGVLIGEPPYVWFTRDTDGDLVVDEKVRIADDYANRGSNPEHAANGLVRGLDNWLHSAMYESRIRLIDGEWVHEPSVRRGQWGISHDNYGRHYTNPNAYYLHVDLVPNHYYPRNENMASQRGVYHRTDDDRSVWPIRMTPGVNRRGQLDREGYLRTFTATCSPLIYRGDNFPGEFVGDAFVAEPAANLIRRAVLSEDGNGVLSSTNAYDEEEFLASTDERFRPVSLYNGPDGTLYIVDMYRGILQHRQFVTTFLRRQILARGLEEPLGLGRIYRVVHDSSEPESAPPMSEMTPDELVSELAHSNGWRRDTAQQLLVESGGASVAPALKTMATEHRDELARIHALWTLEGLGVVEEPLLLAAMEDPSRNVRVTALRVAETRLRDSPGDDLFGRAVDLTFDEDATVRVHAAAALGELAFSREKVAVLADLLRRRSQQPFIREAVLSGFANRELEVLEYIVRDPKWRASERGRAETIAAFTAAVMREREMARVERLLALAVADDTVAWQAIAVLDSVDNSRRAVRLARRPAAFDRRPADPEVARRAAAVFAELEVPEPDTEADPNPEMEALVAEGADKYTLNCAACHQTSGEGMEGLAAPLVDSEWVKGDPGNLVRIVLHGKESGEGLMPPMGRSLSDEDVAAILTYIRASWGNGAGSVTPEDVAAIRGGSSREEPWTPEELLEVGDRE